MAPSKAWTSIYQSAIFATLDASCTFHLTNWALRGLGHQAFLKDFYLRTVPRIIVCILVTNLLRYRWHLWLEAILPTRPSGLQYAARAQDIPLKDDETKKENLSHESTTRDGEFPRRSIRWFNVFAKWMIHLTVGNLWSCMASALLLRVLEFTSLSELFDEFSEEVVFEMSMYFLSAEPLVSLLAFAVVPAYKRVVFENGVSLLWTVFFGAVGRVIYPRLLMLDFVQEIIRNSTMAADSDDYAVLEL